MTLNGFPESHAYDLHGEDTGLIRVRMGVSNTVEDVQILGFTASDHINVKLTTNELVPRCFVPATRDCLQFGET